MAEVRNCPTCGALFNYTGLRDVCGKCADAEEAMYEKVYRFLHKRENRAATIPRIVEITGVQEETIYKWVRKGRLNPALFPNMGYPCDKCGALTKEGKLCTNCQDEIETGLAAFDEAREKEQAEKEKERGTFLARKDR